jgi:hypothetical protein
MVYSTAFGGLFALIFAFANGRASTLGPRAFFALLALSGFICVYLVPNLKYPANSPSAGHPDTIGIRTELYFAVMAFSIAAMAGAAILRKRLALPLGAWDAALIVAATYIVAVVVVVAVMPPINEGPSDFPAVVLQNFRIDSPTPCKRSCGRRLIWVLVR